MKRKTPYMPTTAATPPQCIDPMTHLKGRGYVQDQSRGPVAKEKGRQTIARRRVRHPPQTVSLSLIQGKHVTEQYPRPAYLGPVDPDDPGILAVDGTNPDRS
jgi:hypothetical protein